jgi:hypothetical protein
MLWRLYQRKLMLLFRRWRVSIARVSNEYSCWLRGFPWSLFSGPRPDVAKNVKISSCVAGDNSKASQKSTSRRAVVVRVVKAVISAEKTEFFALESSSSRLSGRLHLASPLEKPIIMKTSTQQRMQIITTGVFVYFLNGSLDRIKFYKKWNSHKLATRCERERRNEFVVRRYVTSAVSSVIHLFRESFQFQFASRQARIPFEAVHFTCVDSLDMLIDTWRENREWQARPGKLRGSRISALRRLRQNSFLWQIDMQI